MEAMVDQENWAEIKERIKEAKILRKEKERNGGEGKGDSLQGNAS